MLKKTIMASDGINRTIEGKVFGDELRIYRVYGDITGVEALKEMAQILALQTNTTKVVYTGL